MKKSPLKRKTPLRKQSKKRKAEWPKYLKLRSELLEPFNYCEFPVVCYNRATQIHHERGRSGPFLTDKRYLWLLCDKCHAWIHNNANTARSMGLLK